MSSNKRIIPLSVPNFNGNEWKYVKQCLDTGWVSSVGSFVTDFEKSVANYIGARHGVAAMNGTAALHVSLLVAGVQPNDLVITPNLTFVATANAVRYAQADPLLIDSDNEHWQMDLDLLEEFLEQQTEPATKGRIHKPSGRRISAIIPVHIQGNIGDMDRLIEICNRFDLFMIEDAAESLGSTFDGKAAGSFGRIGCVSFNGNKIISTGGGGMIVTDDDELAAKLKHLTTTAKTDPMEYFHDQVGYNYRMVNVLAAIGVGQMEQLDEYVERKRRIGEFYQDRLSAVGDVEFQKVLPQVETNWWLFTIRTSKQHELLEHLNAQGIISRPFWMPMNQLPMYKDCIYVQQHDYSTAIHKSSLAIPCSAFISDEELDIVASEITKFYS